LREAVCLGHRGNFSFKSLTFGHFVHENGQKTVSFRGFSPTPTRALLWILLGAPSPDPNYARAPSACHGQTLANPGSAAAIRHTYAGEFETLLVVVQPQVHD